MGSVKSGGLGFCEGVFGDSALFLLGGLQAPDDLAAVGDDLVDLVDLQVEGSAAALRTLLWLVWAS